LEELKLHPQEKALIMLCREIGFGKMEIALQHGLPQHVDELKKKYNLSQLAKENGLM